jgi:hypothetical protein
MDNHIVCECSVNERFLNILGFKPLHLGGCSSVVNHIFKKNGKILCVGIVDNDKKQTSTNFKEFTIELSKTELKTEIPSDILIKKRPDTRHYLILHPNTESWFERMSEEYEISHGCEDFERLETVCKSYKNRKGSPPELSKFDNFLNTLKQKQGSPLFQIKMIIENLELLKP